MEKFKATQTTITAEQLKMKVMNLIGEKDGPQYGAAFLLGARIAMAMEGRPLDKKFTQAQVKVILDGLLLVCLSIYKTIGEDIAAQMFNDSFKNPTTKEVMQ